MSCNIVTYIPGSQCIGDSLETINNNFDKLENVVCSLSTAGFVPVTTDTIAPTFNTTTREFASNVRDLSITSGKLGNGSVIADKIGTNAVTTAKLSAGAVTTDKIALSAVTADRINLVTSLSTNGYQIMPGGLIMQWGQSSTFTTEESRDITFPVRFPNACLQVIAGQIFPTNDGSVNAFIQTVSWNVSSVKMRAQSDLSQPTSSKPIFGNYIAIGY